MSGSGHAQRAAVITGVSSGIGLAIAEDLLQRGYRVFGSVRRGADAEALVKQSSGAFVPLVFDVTDTQALPGIVAQVETVLGGRKLAALVNNAGIAINGPVIHQPMSEIRRMFEVNVFAVLEVTRAFVPLLAHRTATQSPARIVNISSVSGAFTPPFMGGYSASKHALEALTRAMRLELKPHGIEASAIEPGFIRSKIFEKELATKPMERFADTESAAWWQQFNRSAEQAASRARSPEVVTRAVRHAIESTKPRTRYPLDMLCFIRRWTSDRMFDGLILNLMGLDKLLRESSRQSGK